MDSHCLNQPVSDQPIWEFRLDGESAASAVAGWRFCCEPTQVRWRVSWTGGDPSAKYSGSRFIREIHRNAKWVAASNAEEY